MNDIIFFICIFLISNIIQSNNIVSMAIALALTTIVYGYIEIVKSQASNIMEGMSNPKKKKKKIALGKDVNKMLKKQKFPKGKYTFDAKKSYNSTYKSMSPLQVNGLKKDTKDLLTTQTQLMSTLKEMGPVLQQGKSIIGAFDSFFGDKKKNDLEYLTKHLKMDKNKK